MIPSFCFIVYISARRAGPSASANDYWLVLIKRGSCSALLPTPPPPLISSKSSFSFSGIITQVLLFVCACFFVYLFIKLARRRAAGCAPKKKLLLAGLFDPTQLTPFTSVVPQEGFHPPLSV